MLKLGILGNGTVGSGVVELLNKNALYIKKRTGVEVKITKILVRNVEKHINDKNKEFITNKIEDVLKADLDIIVEAIGGIHPAYDYIKTFLQMKKHVVTANKDVIAKYGEELSFIAEQNGVSLRFEASVAGGIPILKPLQECLAGNDIKYLIAILNGTTNFILSKMYNENMKYETALKIAQELGFAEMNPDSDVLGYDSARKLSILSSISYDEKIDWEEMNIEGIKGIDDIDIKYAKELNCNIKLLAISRKDKGEIYAVVKPVLVPKHGQFGKVDNEFNGILLEGDAVGQMFFSGKGAGKLPTASAVLGDIFDVIENKSKKSMFVSSKQSKIIHSWGMKSQWLLRIKCIDKDSIFNILNKTISQFTIITIDEVPQNEVVVLVEAEDEITLDLAIASINNLAKEKVVKKIMKMNI